MSRHTWHARKVYRKRCEAEMARPKRLQPAWGPDSINVRSVFLGMVRARQWDEARKYYTAAVQYGNGETWMPLALHCVGAV